MRSRITRASALLISSLLVLAAESSAQPLRFDTPSVLDDHPRAFRLSQDLTRDADTRERAARGRPTLGQSFQIEARRFAAALLAAGAIAGRDGVHAAVLGDLLAADLGALDRAAGAANRAPDSDLAAAVVLTTRRMRDARPEIETLTNDPAGLDALLRDTLALLAEQALLDPRAFGAEAADARRWTEFGAGPGWTLAPAGAAAASGDIAGAFDRLLRLQTLDDSERATISGFAETLVAARRAWSYRRDAIAVAAAVRSAARWVDETPRGVAQTERQRLLLRLEDAAERLPDPTSRGVALVELWNLSRLLDLATGADDPRTLDMTPNTQRALRRVISVLVSAALDQNAAPGEMAERLRVSETAMRSLRRHADIKPDADPTRGAILRELRLLATANIQRADSMRDDYLDALSESISRPGAGADPSLLAAAGAHARAVDGVEVVALLHDWLADGQNDLAPIAPAPRRGLRERLTELGAQTMDDDVERVEAMAEFDRLTRELRAARLRKWAAVLRDDADVRLAATGDLTVWADAWARGPSMSPVAVQAADRLALVGQYIADRADLETLEIESSSPATGRVGLSARPAAPIPPDALDRITAIWRDRLDAVRTVLADPIPLDAGDARRALSAHAQVAPTARAIARLLRITPLGAPAPAILALTAPATPRDADPSSLAAPLADSPPVVSMLLAHRGALAEFAAIMITWDDAAAAGDRPRAGAAFAEATDRAEALLDVLPEP